DSVHPKLKKQVDKINKEMLEQIELERQLENDLKKAKTKLNNDQFDEADALLEGLESNASFKFADEKIKLVLENYDEKYIYLKKIMIKNINHIKKMRKKQNYNQNMKRN